MEQRRFLSFVVLAMAIFVGWYGFVLPRLMPPPVQQQGDANDDDAKGKDGDDVAKPDDADPDDGPGDVKPAPGDPVAGPDDPPDADPGDDPPVEPRAADVPEHPVESVTLGSADEESGYFLQAIVHSRGAAVESISLNDRRFRELIDADAALKVVGNAPSPLGLGGRLHGARIDGLKYVTKRRNPPENVDDATLVHDLRGGGFVVLNFDHPLGEAERARVVEKVEEALAKTPVTFATAFPDVDEAFEKEDQPGFATRNWNLERTKKDDAGVVNDVTFSLTSVDGDLEVRKRYWLERIDSNEIDLDDARRTKADGYLLRFSLTVRNRGEKPIEAAYELQGPVGVPLEDAENARKYRDLKGAFDAGDSISRATLSAGTVVSQVDDNDLKQWNQPVEYVGVDVQYFAALVLPRGDQAADPYLRHVEAQLIERDSESARYSDVSVTMVSRTIDLKPGESVTHEYDLFAGPKKRAVLSEIAAVDVIDYGWFPFGRGLTKLISDALLSLLNFLHGIGLPYGIAIIGLTMLVRGAMFPISLKQHRNMETMKELQPKIKELQKKYENDKEKMGRALMQLYSEHEYNPLAGCLPMLLQLPIFIGLYQALGNAVELRMAPFLWAKNLAAPDALFELPFSLPFLGSSFNVLPILTIVLFIVQQKMFMPPPTDEQQAAQQKMMKYMMIFMGFLFYRVPAGLCIYFIASSLWGLGERRMLGAVPGGTPSPTGDGDASDDNRDSGRGGGGGRGRDDDSDDDGKGGGSFLSRLLEKADAAGNQTARGNGSSSGDKRERKARKDKGKRRKSRR